MGERKTLLELAEECWKAETHSSELNARIAVTVGATDYRRDYTASLDAALTLVPDGAYLKSLSQFCTLAADGRPRWFCDVQVIRQSVFDRSRIKELAAHSGMCHTAALAVCASALKALAELMKDVEALAAYHKHAEIIP